MWMPHQKSWFSSTIKFLTPFMSRIACLPGIHPLVRLANIYLSLLQGKGGGGDWQFAAEAVAAHSFVSNDKPTFFDVGANRGGWSDDMTGLLGSGTVPCFFLFEPSPACHEMIRKLDIPNARLFQTAVGESSGEINMYVADEASTVSSLHKRRDSFTRDLQFKETMVPIVTIDEIVDSEVVESIDFMKMDVEGHELAVLKGAKKSLESGKIKALSIEFGACNLNSRTFFYDFWDLLTPLGYQFFRITPGRTLLKVEAYYEDLEYFRAATNYIAVLRKS